MPNYFAAYGTFRQHTPRLETPGHEVTRYVGPCLIPGRLYQMGGYPVLKYGPGIVRGDLFELPWTFDYPIWARPDARASSATGQYPDYNKG